METTRQAPPTLPGADSAATIAAEQILLNQAHAALKARGHAAGCRVVSVVIRGETPAGCPFSCEVDQGSALRAVGGTLRGRIKMALALAERPLKGCLLAKRAGAEYNAHFRHVLAGLREEGSVVHVEGAGYWSADREQAVAS